MPLLPHKNLPFLAALSLALAGLVLERAMAGPTLMAPGGGAVHALIVGVNKYRNLGPGAQLSGAAADAKDIAEALSGAGVKILPILDFDATRERFVTEMDHLITSSNPGDFVIIAFAGHGMQVPEYSQWKGIEPNSINEQIAFSGFGFSGDGAGQVVVNKELRAWIARLDAKNVDVLVIMDSCFSGGMTRGFDRRSSRMVTREIKGDVEKSDRDKFIPIEMTEKEARTEVRSLSHVTFLAGATPNSVVPETAGIDPRNTKSVRGALSYFIARAIEGTASNGKDLTREALFRFASQNVRQATGERQFVDIEPRVADEMSLRRVVLRFSGEAVVPVESPRIQPNPDPSLADPIRIAVVNGSTNALEGIEKGAAPFLASKSPNDADLVWDLSNRDAIVRGDIVMHGVDGSLLGGVIDRTWAIRAVQKLSISRTLAVRLQEEGKIYVIGDDPELIVGGVKERYLTVFNIAADGELQLLFPTDQNDALIDNDEWTYRPTVAKPFGVDNVIAAASDRPADAFLRWFNNHNHKRDAALVASEIARWAAADPTLKIGTVGLYTSSYRR
ncbi:MAG: DUF4384 domain-containing protein [Hyphomicrobiales bacterium]|nr:MAG: DUF4384 domain-containing protein [Hyphomicrobiales bacterium]